MYYTDDKYILDGSGNPIPEHDLIKWGRWFESSGMKRVVKKTNVEGYEVSTVFLAMDYNFSPHWLPILYETMVFEREPTEMEILGRKRMIRKSQDADGLYERYHTKEQAIAGHDEIVKTLQSKLENHEAVGR